MEEYFDCRMTLTQALVQFRICIRAFLIARRLLQIGPTRMIVDNIDWELGLSLLLQMFWCWYAADRLFD